MATILETIKQDSTFFDKFYNFQENYSFIEKVENQMDIRRRGRFIKSNKFFFIPEEYSVCWGGNGVTFHDFIIFNRNGGVFSPWHSALNWNPAREETEKKYNFMDEYKNGEEISFINKQKAPIKIGDKFPAYPHLSAAIKAYSGINSELLFGYNSFVSTSYIVVKDICRQEDKELYIFSSDNNESFYSWNHSSIDFVVPLRDLFVEDVYNFDLSQKDLLAIKQEVDSQQDIYDTEAVTSLYRSLLG